MGIVGFGCTQLPLSYATPSVDLIVAATTGDARLRPRLGLLRQHAPDTVRGLSRAATVIDSLRRGAQTPPVVVDAGDILQGNPMAFVAARVDTTIQNPIILGMNAVRYDGVAVGNHEFNYGLPALDRAVRQADFPFLAANVFSPDGTPRFRPWAVSLRLGIKIAIVGATTPGSMVWDRDNLAGRVVITDVIPAVRTAVRDAHDAGASVIIVVVHSGLVEPSSYDTVTTGVPSENVAARLAHEVPGIDLLVYGHSHKEMRRHRHRTTLLSTPNWAASVAIAHLTMERQGTRWRVKAKRSEVVATVRRQENAQVLAVTQEGHAPRWRTTAPIGTTPCVGAATRRASRIRRSSISFSTSSAVRRHTARVHGSVLARRIAGARPDHPWRASPPSIRMNNTLRAVKLSGAQLRVSSSRAPGIFDETSTRMGPSIPRFLDSTSTSSAVPTTPSMCRSRSDRA